MFSKEDEKNLSVLWGHNTGSFEIEGFPCSLTEKILQQLSRISGFSRVQEVKKGVLFVTVDTALLGHTSEDIKSLILQYLKEP